MIYYKLTDAKGHAMNGGTFDFTPYLPKDGKPGEWLPRIDGDLKHCERGYHLSAYWIFWWKENCRIWECGVVESEIVHESDLVGVEEKIVVPTFRIVREYVPRFDSQKNTGDQNTGDQNTGDRNTGHWNTGDGNTGHRNTGDGNTGHRNTGDWNTGDRNTGDGNTGDRNTGDGNTGHRNTGDWNTASHHVGCFNANPPKYIEVFGKPLSRKRFEAIKWPTYFYFDLDATKSYAENWQTAFAKATREEIEATKRLPNFTHKAFADVTGITKKMFDAKHNSTEGK